MSNAHRLCLETIRRHLPGIQVLTDDSFREIWKYDQTLDLWSLLPQHRADYIRVYLLKEFGGLWLDVDVVVLRPFDEVLAMLNEHEFVGYGFFHGRRNRVTNAIMASVPHGQFISALYDHITSRIRKGPLNHYTEIGPAAVQTIRQVIRDPKLRRFLHHWRFQHILHSESDRFHRLRNDEQHRSHANPNAFAYHVTSAALKPIANESRDSLLASRRFIAYLWRKGLGLIRDNPPAQLHS